MEKSQKNKIYKTCGDRFSHILDVMGVEKGYGRTKFIHEFLIKTPEFPTIQYGAVRSWFHTASPPIKKAREVIEALSKEFEIEIEPEEIAVWWKIGGIYPFPVNQDTSILEMQSSLLVMLALEKHGHELKSKDIVKIKDMINDFLVSFADPTKTKPSQEVLELLIESLITKNIKPE